MDGQPATEAAGPLWLAVAVGVSLLLPLIAMIVWRIGRMFRKKRETKMVQDDKTEPAETEPTTGVDLGEAQPLPTVAEYHAAQQVDDEQTARWAAEGIPDEPDTEVHEVPMASTPYGRTSTIYGSPLPTPIVQTERVECEHCQGRGYVPGLNDLLQESIALLGDAGDEVIRLFYTALLGQAPDLASLFPADLLSEQKTGAGPQQRDKLLKALAALAQLYDPADVGKMDHLDQALRQFGRSHAAFVRKDGTIKGATWEEYAAVKDALFTTLIRVAAEHWRPEYSEAWSQAYDYAAGVMLVEQYRSGFAAPRFPRAS